MNSPTRYKANSGWTAIIEKDDVRHYILELWSPAGREDKLILDSLGDVLKGVEKVQGSCGLL